MIKPVVLIIMDGWGLAPPGPGNAISLAKTPHLSRYWLSYPHTELIASGDAVGLPLGEKGNTETGHLNIGAGRVIYQDLPRITIAITDGSFFSNPALLGTVRYANQYNSHIHILGLIGDGGVHAKTEHLYALLDMLKLQKFQGGVYLHLFTDGRDSPPNAGLRLVKEVEKKCQESGIGQIATIMGRYYAMDRDQRWERTQAAYRTLTEKTGATATSAQAAMEAAYQSGITDEFIPPTLILDQNGQAYPRIGNNDAVIFYNFRIDRPRQLTKAFILPDFETTAQNVEFDPHNVEFSGKNVLDDTQLQMRQKPFTRSVVLSNLYFVTMTEYEKNLPCAVAFPPEQVPTPFAKVISDLGLKQLHISETEKERFTGYYFDGLREQPFSGEERAVVPSPKVATYDLEPEMSAFKITDLLLEKLSTDQYSFILVNFANPDMVGHTGKIQAAIHACEVVDECIGKIVTEVLEKQGCCVVTGDHGNVEEMLGKNGEIDTEHSTYPVPFMLIDHVFDTKPMTLPSGKLSDIAPTLLAHMGLPIHPDMTGKNLMAHIEQ